SRLAGAMQLVRHVGYHRLQFRCDGHGLVADLVERNRLAAQILNQDEIMEVEELFKLGVEDRGIVEILHTQCPTPHLVFIRGADAATGRADLPIALACLARVVKRYVIWQDQRAGGRYAQARTDVQAGLFQLADLLEQGFGRQHDTIADVAGDVGMHDARRNQAEDGLVAVDPQRMAGIVPALEADDALRGFRKPVDNLALAFITPLGADDHNVLAHFIFNNNAPAFLMTGPPE